MWHQRVYLYAMFIKLTAYFLPGHAAANFQIKEIPMIALRRFFGLCGLSVLSLALVSTGWLQPRAAAADLDQLDTSLKLVPADAAFYSSMMRNREQYEAVVGSNAWAKIKEMPAVQMGLMFYNMQLSNPESGPAKFNEMMENPETRKIIDMVVDMASDEIFVYGDRSFTGFVQLFQDVNSAQTYGSLSALSAGEPANAQKQQAGEVISTLVKDVNLIGVPNLIVGFRVKNADLAKEQLIKLETIGNIMLESREETKGRFKKTKVGDHEFLVLELDGGMIPWDEVPLDTFRNLEANEGDVDKLVERLKQSKLVVAIGLRGEYLVVSIGSSLDCLKKLGTGPRLIDRDEFKPLAKFADRRLTSIGYMSKAMNQRMNNQKRQIDDALKAVETLLPKAELSEEQQQRIRQDAKRMAADVKAFVPEVGAVTQFSFLVDGGVESYRYAWGDFGGLDGTKQLSLLQHVGGNPLLGIVLRQRVSPANYDLLSKWAKTAYGYFQEYGLPKMQENEREKLEKFLKEALPIVERLDKTNREMLIPALADGQLAFTIDGKMRSKQYCQNMPESKTPLPMLEPALVLGLSDANLFRAALRDYWDALGDLVEALRNVEGSNVPEGFQLPEPEVTEDSEGSFYSIPLPEEWGLDKQIVPNLGVSKDAAVFSFSPAQTTRLLKAAPLSVGGVLAKTNRPLAVAGWFDWAGLVDAATPWIDYALEKAPAMQNIDEGNRQMVAVQVHTVLDVLKVLRTISNESFFENGALVSHTLVEIRDVK